MTKTNMNILIKVLRSIGNTAHFMYNKIAGQSNAGCGYFHEERETFYN